MEYPWRFEGPKVGDTVFAITMDGDGTKFINEVTIARIQDNSYHSRVVDGVFTEEIERAENWNEYNIGYWVGEFELDTALYFGFNMFLTFEEALTWIENWHEETRLENLQKGEDHEQEL